MVGPESEGQANVRKFARFFVVGSSVTVPFFSVTVRKGYGLGAQAMVGGSMMGREGFCVAWPTAEFGGMNFEGAVRLGYPSELAAARAKGGEAAERELFEELLRKMYERGSAISNTVAGELDDTIDPVDTRKWILMTLESCPAKARRRRGEGKKRPAISPW